MKKNNFNEEDYIVLFGDKNFGFRVRNKHTWKDCTYEYVKYMMNKIKETD